MPEKIKKRPMRVRSVSPEKSDKKPSYGFIGFRPSRLMNYRLRTLSKEIGVPISDLVRECVQGYISKLAPAQQPGGIPK